MAPAPRVDWWVAWVWLGLFVACLVCWALVILGAIYAWQLLA